MSNMNNRILARSWRNESFYYLNEYKGSLIALWTWLVGLILESRQRYNNIIINMGLKWFFRSSVCMYFKFKNKYSSNTFYDTAIQLLVIYTWWKHNFRENTFKNTVTYFKTCIILSLFLKSRVSSLIPQKLEAEWTCNYCIFKLKLT